MATTKVLLVEDDKIVATVYQSMLASRGYEVSVAGDGEAGFQMLTSLHPQVVLMDLMLPKLHGIELLKKIRAIPDYEDLPLFVFTNVFVPNLVSEATQAGATAVFSKSTLTPRQLLDAMSIVSVGEPASGKPSAASFPTTIITPSATTPPTYLPPKPQAAPTPTSTTQPTPTPTPSHAPTATPAAAAPQTPAYFPPSPAVAPSTAPHAPTPTAPGLPAATASALAAVTLSKAPTANRPTGHTQFVNRAKAALAGTIPTANTTGNTAYWINEGARLQRELRSNFTQTLDQCTLKLRADLTHLVNTSEETARLELLQSLHAQVRTLSSNAGLAGFRAIADLSAALEAFLRDLVEKSKNYSPSSQRTLQTSLDVLACLMQWKVDANLLEEPTPAILVVDDEVLSRRAVTFALEKGRLKATAVDNPEEGLALASRQPFDLIFLDVQMPGIDGFELCTRIRAEKFNKDTPVIFVTSMSDFKSRAKSTLAGGTELIAKPFLFIELTVKAVTSLLHTRGAAYHDSMVRKVA